MMESITMFALMIVLYPECNRGEACRMVVDTYETFEDLFAYAEATDPDTLGEESNCRKPGWDYLEMEEM